MGGLQVWHVAVLVVFATAVVFAGTLLGYVIRERRRYPRRWIEVHDVPGSHPDAHGWLTTEHTTFEDPTGTGGEGRLAP